VEKYDRGRQVTDDNTIRRMSLACWMPKATDTHSEYVILVAFPRQQWLRERASVLRYTYIACLVFSQSSLTLPLLVTSNYTVTPSMFINMWSETLQKFVLKINIYQLML